ELSRLVSCRSSRTAALVCGRVPHGEVVSAPKVYAKGITRASNRPKHLRRWQIFPGTTLGLCSIERSGRYSPDVLASVRGHNTVRAAQQAATEAAGASKL